MGYWFRAVLAAMASPAMTMCSPQEARNATLKIAKNVSCDPEVDSWREELKGVVQFHSWKTYLALYACCAVGTLAALLIAGSPMSAWEHLRRMQRIKAVRGRLVVSLLSLFKALVVFVGCVQEQLFPGGVPPEGMRCGGVGFGAGSGLQPPAFPVHASGAPGAPGNAQAKRTNTTARGDLGDHALVMGISPGGSVNVYATLYSLCCLLSVQISIAALLPPAKATYSPGTDDLTTWKWDSPARVVSNCWSVISGNFVDPTTDIFAPRLLLWGLLGLLLQLYVLFESASSQASNVVVAVGVLVGFGLVLLPIVGVCSSSSRRTRWVANAILWSALVEVVCDTAILSAIVLLKRPSTDAFSTPWRTLVYHGGALWASVFASRKLNVALKVLIVYYERDGSLQSGAAGVHPSSIVPSVSKEYETTVMSKTPMSPLTPNAAGVLGENGQPKRRECDHLVYLPHPKNFEDNFESETESESEDDRKGGPILELVGSPPPLPVITCTPSSVPAASPAPASSWLPAWLCPDAKLWSRWSRNYADDAQKARNTLFWQRFWARRCKNIIFVVTPFCVVGGLVLVGVVSSIAVRCDGVWKEHLGDAAACAQPQYYFADATCGITKITSFECQNSNVKVLPNTTMYEQMPSLGCIDLGKNPKFSAIPPSWKHLALAYLNISYTSATNLHSWFCLGDMGRTLATIDVAGTPAALRVDWHGTEPKLRSLKDISSACRDAVKETATMLNLSHNLINTNEAMRSVNEIGTAIMSLDIRWNGITSFESVGSNVFKGKEQEIMLQFHPVFANFAARSYTNNQSTLRLPCPVLGLGSGNNVTRMSLINVLFGSTMNCFPATLRELVINGHFFRKDVEIMLLLGPLPDITYLNLDFNLLTLHHDPRVVIADSTFFKIGLSSYLATLPKLRHLSLASNPLRIFDENLSAPIVSLNLAETELRSIPPHLPPTLEHLVLDGNEFTSIPAGSFKACTKLTSLSIVGNRIGNISPGAFKGLRSLVTLDLRFNMIQSIHNESFTGMPNLRHLLLSDNSLKSIDRPVFAELGSLVGLYLQSNAMRDIASNAFAGLENLAVLDLEDNFIKSVPSVRSALSPLNGTLQYL
jgi:Leucine-rich repeat (LRR) protein